MTIPRNDGKPSTPLAQAELIKADIDRRVRAFSPSLSPHTVKSLSVPFGQFEASVEIRRTVPVISLRMPYVSTLYHMTPDDALAMAAALTMQANTAKKAGSEAAE